MTTSESDVRKAFRTCPLCEATCGLEIELHGEKVAAIRGDQEDVFSAGYICPKGTTLGALHEDPDRLRRPLVRQGSELVEATWDEAFAVIERGLLPIIEEHGPSALAIFLGNPNVHNLAGGLFLRPVLKAVPTRNVYSASTLDQMPKHVSSGLLFGSPDAIPVPDLDRTQYLLMLGANPLESNGSLCTAPGFPDRLKRIQGRGGKLVVVDPRRTRTARLADEHLFIQPGTDALFLLAMAHSLFEAERIDLGVVEPWVSGVEEARALCEPFAPELVETACKIDAATIRRIAEELVDAPSAAVYGRIGTHTTPYGTLAAWAVDLLNILTGNLDRPGGAMFSRAAHAQAGGRPGGRGFTTGRWRSRVKGHPEVRGEFPAATLLDEIETPGEGQVRALLTIAGNPVLSAPGGTRLDAALGGLDFMVSVDIYCNETTRHADVILPPPSPLERGHYDLAFAGLSVRNVANYSPPVFAPEGPSEGKILARLALVLGGQGVKADPAALDSLLLNGLADRAVANPASALHGLDAAQVIAGLAEGEATERLLDLLLRAGPYGAGMASDSKGLSLAQLAANPHGVDLGPLEARLPDLLATPSARIELAPEPIVRDLARLRSELTVPPSRGLRLVGRRHVRSNNSWMHNLPALVRGRDRCTLQIHPSDAEALSIADGEAARVASRVGEVVVPAELTEDLMPGVVSLPHGWGHDLPGVRLGVAQSHAGSNSNRLTDGACLDELSGNATLNGIPVEVTPA